MVDKLVFTSPYVVSNDARNRMRKLQALGRDSIRVAGVYFIKERGVLVYVGRSSCNLYGTLYRHFRIWRTYLKVVTYHGNPIEDYTVAAVELPDLRARAFEKKMIEKYQPRDNTAYCDVQANFEKKSKAPF